MSNLRDHDGYPTDEALDDLERFVGTPHEYIDRIASMWAYGGPSVADATSELGREVKRIYFATAGWSGNESVISVIHDSMFWFAFWQMSQRGGAYTFEVPITAWDAWQLQPLTPTPAAPNDTTERPCT